MPSDLGERKEVIPQEPESDFSEDFEEPQLLGSLLRQHEVRGHWPYDKGCDSCVQARGRTPARRRHHEGGDDQSPCTYLNGSRLYFLLLESIGEFLLSGTPLEKMRGARGGQKPSSHPFGTIGFVKPVLLNPGKVI